MAKEKERSFYFQEITKCFLLRRGAPFFLSPRDIALISHWEKTGIPLRVVLDGVEASFECRPAEQPRGKVRSLSFCSGQVKKAFDRHREAKTGRQAAPQPRDEKRIKAGVAVRKFLESLPRDMPELGEIYALALKKMEKRNTREQEFDFLEEQAETALINRATSEDREEVGRLVRAEFRPCGEEEYQSFFRLKLAKFMREKHKIPHLSLYYY